MSLTNIELNEKNQPEKNTYCIIPFIWKGRQAKLIYEIRRQDSR